jgi:hypothetical protein
MPIAINTIKSTDGRKYRSATEGAACGAGVARTFGEDEVNTYFSLCGVNAVMAPAINIAKTTARIGASHILASKCKPSSFLYSISEWVMDYLTLLLREHVLIFEQPNKG